MWGGGAFTTLRIVTEVRNPSAPRKIRLKEGIAKISSSKKFICKGTLRQVFICLRPRTSYPPPPLHTVYVYTLRLYLFTIHTGKGGGVRFETQSREEAGSKKPT